MNWNLQAALDERREAGLLRSRNPHPGNAGPELQIDAETLTAFCSNDYLGLSHHPRVIEATCRATQHCGTGSGASSMISGYHELQQQLEAELASFTGQQACLVFSSGYLTNIGVLDALLGEQDAVFMDRLNHASLLDGARLSGARLRRYLHADADSLGQRLSRDASTGRKLVVTDGVFSMDGDLAPLTTIRKRCDEHEAWLMVDDAHGFGILGNQGRGSADLLGLSPQQTEVYVATLGKALGAAGGFVAGDETLIEYLKQFARTQIYSTALPPAVCAAALEALRVLQDEPEHRERLFQRIRQFRAGAAERGLRLLESETPIQPIVIGDSQAACAVSEQLRAKGLLVPAIRPPTVPAGTARLRITLSAAHSEKQIEYLLDQLAAVLPAALRGAA